MSFPFSDLPDFLADLPNLEELNISFFHEQNNIPPIVFNLPHLRKLLLAEYDPTARRNFQPIARYEGTKIAQYPDFTQTHQLLARTPTPRVSQCRYSYHQ